MPSNPQPGKRRGRPPGRRSAPKPPRQERLELNPGETVRRVQLRTSGNLGQDDVEHHEVIDAQGQIVGTIIYSASTSLKPPFKSSYGLVQTDIAGKVLVDVRW